jgi:acetyltransferase-like isoleucine patch superfamily enzyme
MVKPIIYQGCDIRNGQNIEYGDGVVIQRDVWIDIRHNAKLILKDGCNIGRRCIIGCGKQVTIGENVLLGPNVYVNDMDHEYRDIEKPIVEQGITNPVPLEIGAGSWIGIHSVILASIGKGSVVGANTVIKKNVPSFCVVIGQPGKIVKRYNFKKNKWIRVNWLHRLIFKFFPNEKAWNEKN